MISKEAEREAHEQGEIIVRSPKLDEMANWTANWSLKSKLHTNEAPYMQAQSQFGSAPNFPVSNQSPGMVPITQEQDQSQTQKWKSYLKCKEMTIGITLLLVWEFLFGGKVRENAKNNGE
jgi:hypothetical protein